MRPLGSAVWLALVFAVLAAPSARAALLFHETFADNSAGWTLGAEWQIGPTSPGTGYTLGYPDPAFDRSPGADNGVAGTILGGPVGSAEHGYEWLESPSIDLSAAPGTVYLSWWRWDNSPGNPFTYRVEVWNGSQWAYIYQDAYMATQSQWQPIVIDVTYYKNAAFKVRFGHTRASGSTYTVSGWNVDELALWSGCYDMDGDGADAAQCGGTDCNDFDETIHPGVTELCNLVDDDCDGLVDEGLQSVALFPDYDADGFGALSGRVLACNPALYPGYVTDSTDCNDFNLEIHPGATEVCNGPDDDCDGLYDEGCAYGQILSVSDVGNDQGRSVRLRWFRDQNDGGYTARSVLRYLVFRRVQAGLAPMLANRSLALPPGEWEFVAESPAMREQQYALVVPTLCDSNSSGACRSTFLVRAAYSDGQFGDTPPDSGYSIDNLAPGVPQNLAVSPAGGGALLTWTESPAADFQHFQVHRGPDAGFTPSPATLVHATTGTSWTDPAGQGSRYYKLVAVDLNGNASAPATVHSTLDVGSATAPGALSFASVAPSPFSSAVSIAFDVPAGGGTVRLEVLDLAGRRVRTLSSGTLAAGRHVARWEGTADAGARVAPGVYHLRLTDGSRSVTSRVVLSP